MDLSKVSVSDLVLELRARKVNVDLAAAGTEDLIREVRVRSRAMMLMFVPLSVDGEDYSDIMFHRGMPWEVKGLVKEAGDRLRFMYDGGFGPIETADAEDDDDEGP
jgi:hypothetical protein